MEVEYDNRARVPAYPEIMAGWERDAAAYRAERQAQAEIALAYGPHERHVVDLFHADAPGHGSPLVVFVHGGYWRSLDRLLFSHMAKGANARGISVAVAEYRLCPETTVAGIIADVRAACLFLYRRFAQRLVVCGHSAGGHLAAAMAATAWSSFGPDVPADLVRRGLAMSGVFDLAPLIATSMNAQLRLDEEGARTVSPAFWPVPPDVSFEAWVGAEESSEFLRQSCLLADTWRAAGAHTGFAIMPGLNHFTAPSPLTDPSSPMVEALIALCSDPIGEPPRLDPRPPLP
jgi:arylformamidase